MGYLNYSLMVINCSMAETVFLEKQQNDPLIAHTFTYSNNHLVPRVSRDIVNTEYVLTFHHDVSFEMLCHLRREISRWSIHKLNDILLCDKGRKCIKK